ncbi:hypothetical protein [Actinotalea sp. C106]|uniref:hypothetical protein n=1 Tax=Actinotalea sp. C106 TaxID=2908644 RepID=UPI002028BAEE|nr:hypothetical protein [Actinotalea sp. C106]
MAALVYDDASKMKAGQSRVLLASMDDETKYGPEVHRLGFGEAVGKGLLTDYKVPGRRWTVRPVWP